MISNKIKQILESDTLAMVRRSTPVLITMGDKKINEDEFGINNLSYMQINEQMPKVKNTQIIKVHDVKDNKYFDGIILREPEWQETEKVHYVIVRVTNSNNKQIDENGALRQVRWRQGEWQYDGNKDIIGTVK